MYVAGNVGGALLHLVWTLQRRWRIVLFSVFCCSPPNWRAFTDDDLGAENNLWKITFYYPPASWGSLVSVFCRICRKHNKYCCRKVRSFCSFAHCNIHLFGLKIRKMLSVEVIFMPRPSKCYCWNGCAGSVLVKKKKKQMSDGVIELTWDKFSTPHE